MNKARSYFRCWYISTELAGRARFGQLIADKLGAFSTLRIPKQRGTFETQLELVRNVGIDENMTKQAVCLGPNLELVGEELVVQLIVTRL